MRSSSYANLQQESVILTKEIRHEKTQWEVKYLVSTDEHSEPLWYSSLVRFASGFFSLLCKHRSSL